MATKKAKTKKLAGKRKTSTKAPSAKQALQGHIGEIQALKSRLAAGSKSDLDAVGEHLEKLSGSASSILGLVK